MNEMYELPQEVRKWNWGAFIFSVFWGIGNKTYLPLLCLIPVFNIVWIFVCGAKGNEWAWKSGMFQDLETFKKAQATWNRAGLVVFIIAIALIALYILFIILIIALAAANY
ncbi:hypothetical protein RV11_GL003015 [Enterococcus phoeniculicola]|jgi:hypothetical protein|uniref:Uncharacterized protein n=1 Tax=Enterococcus phoeniculicola ATCC BAA-412 TaxID=1158610 RepID=R3W539_9ENTE|nr:hypothetical protein [Enterococcus phoeniculicola]EOL42691.1 hypothetical protein UC3_03044 [Enterococcus phoeniculicola ATCC BAA-412]EOT79025.1 hypothetical protein I589_00532 [Enterococcus phoeniculicola ATCC BAA-412]OJG72433.1 hypothetical protein RV11_GL003015 [Enterococcus phoeniculicola]